MGLLLRSVRTPYGQSGSLRGLELIPERRRSLVLGERQDGAQSRPPALIRVLHNTPAPNAGTMYAGASPLGKNILGGAAQSHSLRSGTMTQAVGRRNSYLSFQSPGKSEK